jgi:hypothetical protein
MTQDLAIVDLLWKIELARNGDGEMLAQLLRLQGERPLHPALKKFLADVVAGKVKLKRPRWLTWRWKHVDRYWREGRVVFMVDFEMEKRGKQRDKHLRKKLTSKWCKEFDTNERAVAEYRKREPRRAF